MIHADNFEWRCQAPQLSSERDVIARVDPELHAGPVRRIAHRRRMRHTTTLTDQKATAFARRLTARVRQDGPPDRGRKGRPHGPHHCSSGRSRYSSSAAGLASASRFFTGRP